MAEDKVVLEKIGSAIELCRKNLGLTQAQVARKVGISQPLYAYYEAGKRRLPIPTLIKIADALGVSPEELLPVQPKKPGPQSALEKELAKVRALPEKQQQLVLKLIETVINSASKA